MMRDYLVHVPSLDAVADQIKAWATKIESEWTFHLPTFCDCLPVTAYGLGEQPQVLPGAWFIVSIGTGNEPPPEVLATVVAEADRYEGLMLPAGVGSLSPLWAGMSVKEA